MPWITAKYIQKELRRLKNFLSTKKNNRLLSLIFVYYLRKGKTNKDLQSQYIATAIPTVVRSTNNLSVINIAKKELHSIQSKKQWSVNIKFLIILFILFLIIVFPKKLKPVLSII
jgi:hypothetical protein